MLTVRLRSMDIRVETSGDPYGEAFWKSIENQNYEPDTLSFIENNVSSDCIFMDIGAANGAMTLIAAQYAKNVFAYEPDPKMFSILSRNVELNTSTSKKVFLKNVGISNTITKIEFSKRSDKSIFSSIVVGNDNKSGDIIDVLSLKEELESINSQKDRIIIKMDIEGAEWRILNDQLVLQELKSCHATVLLAVHPGFYRPHVKLMRGFDKLSLLFWQARNYLESLRTFKKLDLYCEIKRTNLNPVRNPRSFATLVFGGYHEFILKF